VNLTLGIYNIYIFCFVYTYECIHSCSYVREHLILSVHMFKSEYVPRAYIYMHEGHSHEVADLSFVARGGGNFKRAPGH